MEKETIIYKNRITAATFAAIALPCLLVGFLLGFLTTKKVAPPPRETVEITVGRDTTDVIDTVQAEIPAPTEVKPVKTIKIEIKPAVKPARQDTPQAKPDTAVQALPGVTVAGDTVKLSQGIRLTPQGIDIDLEEKVYQTDQYKATIQGWRPELVGMEVYPRTTTIREVETRTVTQTKSPRWGVVVGPGVGYTGTAVVPMVGVTAGLVIGSR